VQLSLRSYACAPVEPNDIRLKSSSPYPHLVISNPGKFIPGLKPG